jgi:hypothetical protein
MGAGGSVSFDQARKNAEKADELFGKMSTSGGVHLSVDEVYAEVVKHGDSLKAYWTRDQIEKVVQTFDKDNDGRITKEEFMDILSYMVDKKRSLKELKGKKSGTSLKATTVAVKNKKPLAKGGTPVQQQRRWTWAKRFSTIKYMPDGDDDAGNDEANQGDDGELYMTTHGAPARRSSTKRSSIVSIFGDIFKVASDEDRRAEYWAKQDARTDNCWSCPFARKMPGAINGETCMMAAIARAQSLGRTPLLLDDATKRTSVDSVFGEASAVTIDASAMYADERQGKRTHLEIMKANRSALVEAMRRGVPLYVRLGDKTADFAGGDAGGYCGEDTLPFQVFEPESLKGLHETYHGAADGTHQNPEWSGLWQSDHPFAKVLRANDLDMKTGKFFVAKGFGVVVSTHLSKDVYKERLRNSLPCFHRLQPILTAHQDN